jgi:hypothetical protein
LPLNSRQKELCKRKPYLLPSIREGARLGIQECRSQFRYERWNCMVATATATVTATAGPFGTSPLFGYELNSGESRDTEGFRDTEGDSSSANRWCLRGPLALISRKRPFSLGIWERQRPDLGCRCASWRGRFPRSRAGRSVLQLFLLAAAPRQSWGKT